MYSYHRMAQYYETDGMGIIHHANYLHWFEEARIAWMDDFGYGYDKLEQLGVASPLTGLSVQYLKPVRFKDEVVVQTRLTHYDGVRITVDYALYVGDTQVCSAQTHHVLTDLRTGMVLRTRRACPELDAALKAQCEEGTAE